MVRLFTLPRTRLHILGMFLFVGLCIPQAGISQDRVALDRMSPEELFALREQYIAAFPRTSLNTTRGDALFLRIMVQGMQARRGVEVGSATGYGALHMGMGFEHTGGRLYTIDIDADMVEKCRAHLRNVGLERTVTCIEGDALEVLPKLEGEFDFVFIDAAKRDYYAYFKAIEPKLKPGAVIVADNVIRYAYAMRDFLSAMEADPAYDMLIFQASQEKGDGMAVIYKRK